MSTPRTKLPHHLPDAVEAAPATSAGDGRVICSGLTRRFGAHVALAPLDLEVGPGGISGLLGPNGSGKSTLLRCLTGLVRPDKGRVTVDGVELRGDGTEIRRRTTYAPGELHLYGEMRADEQLAWLLRGRGPEACARATALGEDLGLPLTRRVRTFSHGMKRQLLLSAALAPDVRVRLLDEPTEGLDPHLRGRVLELLRADAGRGTTVLLSSHHLGEVERACDRLLFLNEGRLLADETPAGVAAAARRFVHVTWPAGTNVASLEGRLADAAAEVRIAGRRTTLRTRDEDPRALLRAVCSADLPQPETIEYGTGSLADLYHDLYGVEGV